MKIKSIEISNDYNGKKVVLKVNSGNAIIYITLTDDAIFESSLSAIVNILHENSNSIVSELYKSFGINKGDGDD